MKKLLKIFSTLAFILPSTVNAYDFDVDGIYYNVISFSDMTCSVTYHNYPATDIVIPNSVTYNGKTLSVIKIEEKAFYNTKIRSIEIPNSVKSIGYGVFMYCDSLKQVKLPDGISKIPSQLFYSCVMLTTCEIPSTVTSIGQEAFRDCVSLKTIELPYNLTNIGVGAFRNSGIRSIVIPENITVIPWGAFHNCRDLVSVIFPDNLESINGYRDSSDNSHYGAFSKCKSLTSITIPDNVKTIQNYAFEECDKLKKISIGKGISDVDSYAFLKTYPNDVTYRCNNSCNIPKDSIGRITISDVVSDFSSFQFSQYIKIKELVSQSQTPPILNGYAFSNPQILNLPVYVPEGSLSAYQNADVWKELWNLKEGDVNGNGNPEQAQCKKPTISYSNSNREISFTCETEGVKFQSTVSSNDMGSYLNNKIKLNTVYDISVYAYADGYKNSETVSAKLYWVGATLNPEMISTIKSDVNSDGEVNISDVNAVINQILAGSSDYQLTTLDVRGVLVQKDGNSLIISGLYENEQIALTDESGSQLGKIKAESGSAKFNIYPEKNMIVTIGNKSIKLDF